MKQSLRNKTNYSHIKAVNKFNGESHKIVLSFYARNVFRTFSFIELTKNGWVSKSIEYIISRAELHDTGERHSLCVYRNLQINFIPKSGFMQEQYKNKFNKP